MMYWAARPLSNLACRKPGWTALVWAMLAFTLTATANDFQGSLHKVPYDEEIINYDARTPDEPVARLQEKINQGVVKLRFDPKFGYLLSLLEALEVPKSAQMLVFSKTSLQRSHITPRHPRAIFFNDNVYLGFIPDAPLMEVSAVDPKLGGIFYTLEQTDAAKPQFRREAQCLTCHGAAKTLGVPGHFVRSIGTDETGELDTQNEISIITQRTPLSDRWAGWYVTGTHGSQTHRGNLIGSAAFERQLKEPNYLGNVTELGRFFDVTMYPGTGSDLVALMVLEHQAHMHNYITRLNFETQIMLKTYGHIRYLRNQVDAFLRYLLFTEEVLLTSPISGNPGFVKDFTRLGPRDRRGRSLRDFDLRTRLFKYPCSFLIYSPAFDSLPNPMRDQLLHKLYEILTGANPSPDFAKLRAEDRQAILEILRETKPDLPGYWADSLKSGTAEK